MTFNAEDISLPEGKIHCFRAIIFNDFDHVRGGADEVAITEARGLADLGWEVDFVTGLVEGADARLLHPCIHLFPVVASGASPVKLGLIKTLWNNRAAGEVRRILKSRARAGGCILHVHGWTKNLTAAVLKEVVFSGLPVAATLHDYFSVCPNGALYQYPSAQPCHVKPMSASCHWARCDRTSHLHKFWRLARQHLLHLVARWPGKVRRAFAVSEFAAGKLRPYLPAGFDLRVLPNPVAVTLRPRLKPELRNIVMYVGRLTEEKGVLDLARAAGAAEVRVRFVGAGPMDNLIKEVNPEAELTGWSDKAGVLRQLSDARVVVLPSRWWETQGLSAMEALAQGIPVIVADETGAADYIKNGVNGWRYPAGDVVALEEILRFAVRVDIEPFSRRAYGLYWDCPPAPEIHVRSLCSHYIEMIESDVREVRI